MKPVSLMKLILQYSNRSLLPGEFDVIVMDEILLLILYVDLKFVLQE